MSNGPGAGLSYRTSASIYVIFTPVAVSVGHRPFIFRFSLGGEKERKGGQEREREKRGVYQQNKKIIGKGSSRAVTFSPAA